MEWTCSACGLSTSTDGSRCEGCGAARPAPAATGRDLPTETHLYAIAWWLRADGAFFAVLALLQLVVLLLSNVDGDEVLRALAGVLFLAALGVGHLVVGHALSGFSGRARWVAALREMMSFATSLVGYGATVWLFARGLSAGREALVYTLLVVFSVGRLVWKGARVWTLLSSRAARVCTSDYRALVAGEGDMRPSILRSPFFWIPWVGLATVLLLLYLFAHSA